MDGYVHAAEIVSLKHDFAHAFSVLEWVHRRFRQKDFATGGVYLEFFGKCVVPKVLHIVPAADDAVFHLKYGEETPPS